MQRCASISYDYIFVDMQVNKNKISIKESEKLLIQLLQLLIDREADSFQQNEEPKPLRKIQIKTFT